MYYIKTTGKRRQHKGKNNYKLLNRINFFFRSICCLTAFFLIPACGSPTNKLAPKTAEKPTVKENYKILEDLDQSMFLLHKIDQKAAQKVHPSIFKATGFGNSFLVTTKEGSIIIDTGLVFTAKKQKKLLSAISDAPAKAIFITHAHGDHTGGIDLWKEKDTQVIMHKNCVEFLHYQKRIQKFLLTRGAAQFGFDQKLAFKLMDSYRNLIEKFKSGENVNYNADIPATLLVDDQYTYKLGEYTFQVIHTPGETYDAISIFIPEIKALFIGDLYYASFPNIYTLRGTKPRYALDYVQSIDKLLPLGAEILLPSHGEPVLGAEKIKKTLTTYRDAILYVHDQTVSGMNAGKDVYTLMKEIHLPANLDVGESYGKVSWSVRGIYEGYAGWFDGNPATMYAMPEKDIVGDLIALAGGPEKACGLAKGFLDKGELTKALRLTQGILALDAGNRNALKTQLTVYKTLRKQSVNFNEAGWLDYGIRTTESELAKIQ